MLKTVVLNNSKHPIRNSVAHIILRKKTTVKIDKVQWRHKILYLYAHQVHAAMLKIKFFGMWNKIGVQTWTTLNTFKCNYLTPLQNKRLSY